VESLNRDKEGSSMWHMCVENGGELSKRRPRRGISGGDGSLIMAKSPKISRNMPVLAMVIQSDLRLNLRHMMALYLSLYLIRLQLHSGLLILEINFLAIL